MRGEDRHESNYSVKKRQGESKITKIGETNNYVEAKKRGRNRKQEGRMEGGKREGTDGDKQHMVESNTQAKSTYIYLILELTKERKIGRTKKRTRKKRERRRGK